MVANPRPVQALDVILGDALGSHGFWHSAMMDDQRLDVSQRARAVLFGGVHGQLVDHILDHGLGDLPCA